MNAQRKWAPLGLLFLLLFGVGDAGAQEPAPVLIKTTEQRGSIISSPDPTILREHNITVDLGALRGPRNQILRLPLFDATQVVVIKDRQETPRENAFLWYGHVADMPGTSVVLSNVGDALAGTLITRGPLGRLVVYSIRYIGNGVHVLRQINQASFPPDGDPAKAKIPANNAGADICAGDPATGIDALIVYTDDVLSHAASVSAVESEIYDAVALTNLSYANSDVSQRLRVVHMQEIDYFESRDGEKDRDRLQNPSDGYLDEVQNLRNAYSADVVALIVERIDGACGWAYVMDEVTNAFAPYAYAVVRRSCAADNLSLAHEFGHVMGAHHDRFNDKVTDPSGYNYGYVKKTPSTPGEPWYTIMATYAECSAAPVVDCVRIPYWSNPGKNAPASYGGDPMGVQDSEDNHRRLNETASTVANFRCVSPSVNNVWMKDTPDDAGGEPDPHTVGEDMWKSDSIWIRNTQDPNGAHQHDHENPLAGKANWIYVEMQNGGGHAFGDLEVYFADASTSLDWPVGWTLIAKTQVDFAPASTRVIEIPWTPTQAGHFCLLARWASPADPMAVPEAAGIESNVRNNNNIVWRNVNIIDLTSNPAADATFAVRPPGEDDRPFSIVVRGATTRDGKPPATPIRLTIELDDSLFKTWKQRGARTQNLRNDGRRFFVAQTGEGRVENLHLERGTEGHVKLTFERLTATRSRDIIVDVLQVQGEGVAGPKEHAIGGVSYIVRTDPAGGGGR